MTDAELVPLLDLLEARIGLRYEHVRASRIREAVERVRRSAGCPTVEALTERLSRDGALFDALVAALAVGESYFFRDRGQLEVLRERILPRLAARRPLHVWSAGCSRGEEAYTLAMVLAEAGCDGRVLGTDLSRPALADAQHGAYRRWSLRATRPDELARYFEPEGERQRVRAQLRRSVSFAHHNLLEPPPAPHRFHLALCRNVLIYLTPDAVDAVARRLRDALVPGGWLLTGPSDPALRVDGLEAVSTGIGLVYRRAANAEPRDAAPAAWRTGRSARPDAAARRRAARAEPGAAAPVRSGPPAAAARTPAPPSSDAGAGDPAARVRALADRGRDAEALAAIREGVAAWPLDPELRYLGGVVHLAAGRLDEAADALRTARYLAAGEAADLAAIHLTLARVEAARGRPSDAARGLEAAGRILRALPREAPVRLIGAPAGRLADLALAPAGPHAAGGAP